MDKAYLSPNMENKLIRTSLMQTVRDDNFPYEKWIDPLDPRLINLLEGVKSYKTIIWNGTPLTTISQRYYGNTSLFFVILMFNGFLHPHEILNGTILKIPALNTQNLISKPKKSQILKGV